MIRIVLVGAEGRMGRAVAQAAQSDPEVAIAAGFGRPAAGADGVDTIAAALRAGDVVVDFSTPEGLRAAAAACARQKAGLVTGTTGLGPAEEALLGEAARGVAVVRAANFSLGVVALRKALAAALAAAPGSWDLEIVERHHRDKADAPSGTALALARQSAAQRGLDERAFRHGREGRLGPRPAKEIGIHAVRGGTWVGDHTVLLAGPGEWLELRHVAQDRSAFAHGAIRAARIVATAPAGLYTLEDLIAPGRPA